jgi:hypothetical protein
VTRLIAARAGLVLLLWLLGGRVGLLVGLAIAVCDQLWAPSPAQLLRAALLGFCLLPLAVLARGLPTPATVTPLFAGSNLAAHYLAGTALALLVLGILRDVRPATRAAGPGNGPPPPGGNDLRRPLPPPAAKDRPAGPAGPDDAGLRGNGARKPLRAPARALPAPAPPAPAPPAPAPPTATHPPLWDPARRRRAGNNAPPQPAGADPSPGEATATSPPAAADRPGAATHPPLWDPARRRASPAPDREPGERPAPASAESADGPARPQPDHADDQSGPRGRHPPELRIAGGGAGPRPARPEDSPVPEDGQGSDP